MKKNIEIIKFDLFKNISFLKHGFSTRYGGVSKNEYLSMNLRFNSSDRVENIEKNLEIFLDKFNVDKKDVVFSDQIHSDNIKIVSSQDENIQNIDGLITNKNNIGLMTFHADCVPLFFVDYKKRIIGLAHSGWQGSLKGISNKMINIFLKKYDSNIENILVGIGPSIGICCYEVGNDLYNKFTNKKKSYKKFFVKKKKYHLDLKKLIKYDLLSLGILKKNIEINNLCTKCNNDLFFSHRANGNKRGTMAAFIIKKDQNQLRF
ncbi:MAG: peptidoglycan editing factor PgeF [Bacillota bacterium]